MWLLGSVIRTIGYPNYRWSQLVRIIDVLLYLLLRPLLNELDLKTMPIYFTVINSNLVFLKLMK